MAEIDRPKPGYADAIPEPPERRIRWWRLVLWVFVSVALAVGGAMLHVVEWALIVSVLAFLILGVAHLALRFLIS